MPDLTPAQQLMIEDGLPAEIATKTPEERAAAWAGRKLRATITFADKKPAKDEDPATKQLRKEMAAAEAKKKAERFARLKELNQAKKAAKPKETAMTTKSKTSKKPAAKKSAPAKTKAPAKKAAPKAHKPAVARAPKEAGVRPGSKLEAIVGLLRRPEGCTTADVLKATDWPSVSMPQQAKAAGITLLKEKVDGKTVYRAAA